MRNVPLGCVMDLPLEYARALRRLVLRKFPTIKDAAKAAGVPLYRLDALLNGRGELTPRQYRRLYAVLGIWDRVVSSSIKIMNEA